MSAAHPLLDVLVALFCRPGGAGEGAQDMQRTHIAWLLASGQWVAIGGPDGALWGWAAFYLTDDAGFTALRDTGFADLVQRAQLVPLTHGDRAYIAAATVRPGAPRGLYRCLCRRVACAAAAMGARSIGGHANKRDGRRYWHERLLP